MYSPGGRTIALLLLLFVGASLPGPVIAAKSAENDVMLDLPAMTLTPADLEAAGVDD